MFLLASYFFFLIQKCKSLCLSPFYFFIFFTLIQGTHVRYGEKKLQQCTKHKRNNMKLHKRGAVEVAKVLILVVPRELCNFLSTFVRQKSLLYICSVPFVKRRLKNIREKISRETKVYVKPCHTYYSLIQSSLLFSFPLETQFKL